LKQKSNQAVLIVDDEPIVRDSLRDWLTSNGYHVVTSTSGEEALGKIKEQDFQLLILDIRLKRGNGIDLLEEAKTHNPNVKAIIITAYPSVETIEKATKLGVVNYLTKPFELDDLDKSLQEILGKKEATQEPTKAPAEKAKEAREKAITSMMEEKRVFISPEDFREKAAISSFRSYKAIYNWSVTDPEGFWGEMAEQLDWYRKWDRFVEYDFKDKPEVRFFIGGKIQRLLQLP